MKHGEVDFGKVFQKQLDDAQFAKNIFEFGRKFRIEIRDASTLEEQYNLLKEDFERVYTNFNFEEEWQMII